MTRLLLIGGVVLATLVGTVGCAQQPTSGADIEVEPNEPVQQPTEGRIDLASFTEEVLAIEDRRGGMALTAALVAPGFRAYLAQAYVEGQGTGEWSDGIAMLKAQLMSLEAPEEMRPIKDMIVDVYDLELRSIQLRSRREELATTWTTGRGSTPQLIGTTSSLGAQLSEPLQVTPRYGSEPSFCERNCTTTGTGY